jgi:cystathionine beta-lyase
MDLDAITVESLHAAGGLKWTKFGADKHAAVERAQFGYLPPALAEELGEVCAEWQCDTYGWRVAPADIRPLPDVIRGLELAIEHCSRPGAPVILPVPAYMPFFDVPGNLGREIIQIGMVDDGRRSVYDLDALDRAFAAGGNLMILCNPHNPLGRVMERDELAAIAEVVARHDGRVFADEIHAPLVYDGHRHVPYASLSEVSAGHTITATSASKAWNLPGLKCAELILSNDTDRRRFDELGPFATHGASTLGVVANIVAFRDGRPWLDEVVEHLGGNRRLLAELLAEHLPEVRYTPPEGTYLAWLDCRALGLPEAIGDFFTDEAGVVPVDGARCGPPGQGFVRLNFATTRPILTEMVERMAAAAARHRAT